MKVNNSKVYKWNQSKSDVIISINTEHVFEKIQYLLMIILKETGNRRNNIIKAIYNKPMHIVLNAKENKAFTLKLGM